MGNSYSSDERRRANRTKAGFIVAYKVDSPLQVRIRAEGKEIDAVMQDLSSSGMSISTNFNIPALAIVSMSFTLINQDAMTDNERIRRIQIVGQVCNTKPENKNEYRLGIRFTHISEEDKRAIADFTAPPRSKSA